MARATASVLRRKTRHRGGKAAPSRMPPSQETGGVSIAKESWPRSGGLKFATTFKLPREREPEDKNETSCAAFCILRFLFFTPRNFKFHPRSIECNNFWTRNGPQRRGHCRRADYRHARFEKRRRDSIQKPRQWLLFRHAREGRIPNSHRAPPDGARRTGIYSRPGRTSNMGRPARTRAAIFHRRGLGASRA